MHKDTSKLLEQLKKATKGLLFQSESDYPVEPFHIEGNGKKLIGPQEILELGRHPAKAQVKKINLDDFFSTATEEQDWHGREEQEAVRRFRELVGLLKENLADIQVFKVGKTESDVYVLGRMQSGDFVGVSTKLVET